MPCLMLPHMSLREGTIGCQDGNRMSPNVAETPYILFKKNYMLVHNNIEERMVEVGEKGEILRYQLSSRLVKQRTGES